MLTLVIVGILLLVGIYFIYGRIGKSIPGPTGLPFIGSALQLDQTGSHKSVAVWHKMYGDIFRFKMFGTDCVVLSGYDNIHHALNSDDFAGRPPMYRFSVMYNHTASIVSGNYSQKWMFLKKVATQSLKKYGNKLQDISLMHIEQMIKDLDIVAKRGEPTDIKNILHRCIASIITSIMYGHPLDAPAIDDVLRCEETFNEQITQAGCGRILDIFPWMRYFPLRSYYKKLVAARSLVITSINEQIEHTKEGHISGKPKCYVDELLDFQVQHTEANSKFILTDEDVYALTFDILNAGTSTTITTLYALMAVLTNKPDIQKRLVQEIQSILGKRNPCLEDRDKLPYVQATLLEHLRYHTLLPLGLIHMTTKDTIISGYDIPKGSTVFFNMWELNHDPEFWKDPWDFSPERFLDENGKLVDIDHPNRKRLMPFGAGRRLCLGETLARNRLFLVVTSILQHFYLEPESPDRRPSHDPRTYRSGFNVYPEPFRVLLKHVKE